MNAASLHDFDFLHGRWRVKHRILRSRGIASTEWLNYDGAAETRSLLDGLCNIETHRIVGRDSGIALRCFDRRVGQWAIYWVSSRDGRLQPVVHGRFDGETGLFWGDDMHDGRRVRVCFEWQKNAAGGPRWEQAYSFDDGGSWESNWIMEFQRVE